MVGIGEFVYNTEQRREMLRQMKEHLQNEWLKRKAEGRLSKKKIILPGAEPIKTIRKISPRKKKIILPNTEVIKKEKTKKRKRRLRVFKVIQGTRYGDQIILEEIKRIKRKNRKYKNGRYFKRSDR